MNKILIIMLALVPLSAGANNDANATVDSSTQNDAVVTQAAAESELYIPDEMSFTDRFIVTELRDLRIDLERTRTEMYKQIQEKEIGVVDRALSYSANTVNFFFVLLTVILTGGGLVGWKTLSDIKKSTRASMEKETMKIIDDFQDKIKELEKEQKINILWRQFNTAESDKEKLDILNRVQNITPRSMYAKLEKTNVYLDMELYSKVIDNATEIIDSDITKYRAHALYNRACAYINTGETENSLNDLNHLIKIAPDYRENLIENKVFDSLRKNSKFKALL